MAGRSGKKVMSNNKSTFNWLALSFLITAIIHFGCMFVFEEVCFFVHFIVVVVVVIVIVIVVVVVFVVLFVVLKESYE